ncbi:MAG: ABC transporter substrate-binding protein [Eubacterium sp.]|nr:ABC transporter substrate-binding protein [Eubacterium sp.]
MKKTLALILAAVLACGMLTACSGGGSGTSQESSAPEAASSAASESSAVSETAGTSAESTAPEAAETILVTDAVGREVELSGLVEKAAVINRYNLELIRGCGLIDKVVGVDSSIIENHVYWPEFSEENSFGSQNDVNYEVIAEMEPDVVITAFYSEDLENALKAFNIPVVALIGYDQDINRQIDIIETMFGKTEKSSALRSFFNETYQSISDIAAQIPEAERKTTAWESIKDYSIANGSNAWGEMLVLAGGINMFGDASFESSDVDAEAFITANPDFIFKMVAASGADLSGYTPPSAEDYKAAADAYLGRAGFGEIKAVQDENVYFVTSFSMGGLGKILGSAYIVKWLYPEAAADFDPDKVFATWLEEYQNIDYVEGQHCRLGDID